MIYINENKSSEFEDIVFESEMINSIAYVSEGYGYITEAMNVKGFFDTILKAFKWLGKKLKEIKNAILSVFKKETEKDKDIVDDVKEVKRDVEKAGSAEEYIKNKAEDFEDMMKKGNGDIKKAADEVKEAKRNAAFNMKDRHDDLNDAINRMNASVYNTDTSNSGVKNIRQSPEWNVSIREVDDTGDMLTKIPDVKEIISKGGSKLSKLGLEPRYIPRNIQDVRSKQDIYEKASDFKVSEFRKNVLNDIIWSGTDSIEEFKSEMRSACVSESAINVNVIEYLENGKINTFIKTIESLNSDIKRLSDPFKTLEWQTNQYISEITRVKSDLERAQNAAENSGDSRGVSLAIKYVGDMMLGKKEIVNVASAVTMTRIEMLKLKADYARRVLKRAAKLKAKGLSPIKESYFFNIDII